MVYYVKLECMRRVYTDVPTGTDEAGAYKPLHRAMCEYLRGAGEADQEREWEIDEVEQITDTIWLAEASGEVVYKIVGDDVEDASNKAWWLSIDRGFIPLYVVDVDVEQ